MIGDEGQFGGDAEPSGFVGTLELRNDIHQGNFPDAALPDIVIDLHTARPIGLVTKTAAKGQLLPSSARGLAIC